MALKYFFRRLGYYLNYRLNAKGRYGLHSPFLYKFYTEVIKSQKYYYKYDEIEDLREQLLNNKRTIVMEGLKYPVSLPIKNLVYHKNIIPFKLGVLLFEMVLYFQPKTILEIGRDSGLSTLYMISASPKIKFYTFKVSKESIQQKLIMFLKKEVILDFIFINVNSKFILKYFLLLLPKINHETVIIFKDIYKSKEMKEAWEKLRNHQCVKISVDLFSVGIIFFKQKQSKQHFILKY